MGEIQKDSQQDPIKCEFCGDVNAKLFLHAKCHPTAPLKADLDGDILTLTCYIPECMRDVVKFRIAEVLK